MWGRLIEQSRRRLVVKGGIATALAIVLVFLVGVACDYSVVGLGLTALLILLLGAFWSERIVGPLGHAVAVMEQLERDKTDIQPPYSNGQDEVGRLLRLARRYRDVALRLRAAEDELTRLRFHLRTLEDTRARERDAEATVEKHQAANDIETVSFDLIGILNGVSALLSSQAGKKGFRLVMDVAPGVPSGLVGDPLSLGQVLVQLIGNAIKYSNRGSIVVQVREKTCTGNDVELQFSVRDRGIGLTPKQQAAFFLALKPADDTAIGGVGLGLSICKRLVEGMGGSIYVESQYGAGSNFHFTARLKVATLRVAETVPSASVVEGRGPGRQGSGLGLKGKRVLLVGDGELRKEVVADALRDAGLLVRIVANGVEALQAVREQKPDCVLMDCRMPIMDGFEATSRLRSLGFTRLPIIGLAANVRFSDRESGLAAGMNDLVGKTDDLAVLLAALVKWTVPPKPGKPISAPAMVKAVPSDGGDNGTPLPPLPPGLDVESGLKRLRGQTALFLKALRIFRDSRGYQFQLEFQAAIAAEDWQTSERLAHGLKGTAAAIGANELSAAAALLEAAIQAGEYGEVQSLLADLTDKLRTIVDGLAHIG